jgi:type II secretory pathway pseudopilin PulG
MRAIGLSMCHDGAQPVLVGNQRMADVATRLLTVPDMNRRHRALAFTLVELVIGIALVGVIGLVAVQVFDTQRSTTTDSAARQVLEQAAAVQDLEFSTRGSYTEDPLRLGGQLSGVDVVTGDAQDGQISVGLGTVDGLEGYGLAYHAGGRCHTLRAGPETQPLLGRFDASAVACTADLALQGAMG